MACAPSFLGAGAMLVSAHDGGVDHPVFVVVIAGQELENPLENAALGPSVEALIDDLPVAKALGQITPRASSARRAMAQIDDLGRSASLTEAKSANIHAGFRPAQSRDERDEQHWRAFVPRVEITRIANLAQNGNQRFHQEPPESGSLFFYRSRNPPYSSAIPLGSALSLVTRF
jgi:hypothetical protein